MDGLQEFLDQRIRDTGISNPSLDELNVFMGEFMQERNSRPLDSFEGYSPMEMHAVLHAPFGEDCPVRFADFTAEDCKLVPLFRQVKSLLATLADEGGVKLTKIGNLPVRIVSSLYAAGAPDWHIENDICKLKSETDSVSVQMARIAAALMRAVKTRNGVLSLTKKGSGMLADDRKLMTEMLTIMFTQFSPAFFDYYWSSNIGALGRGFTLIMLDKYGDESHPDRFYADKYFGAFPALINEVTSKYKHTPPEVEASNIYSLRTFNVLLHNLGFVEIERTGQWPDQKEMINRTDTFHAFFQIHPPHAK